jgi:hypothetical protein
VNELSHHSPLFAVTIEVHAVATKLIPKSPTMASQNPVAGTSNLRTIPCTFSDCSRVFRNRSGLLKHTRTMHAHPRPPPQAGGSNHRRSSPSPIREPRSPDQTAGVYGDLPSPAPSPSPVDRNSRVDSNSQRDFHPFINGNVLALDS